MNGTTPEPAMPPQNPYEGRIAPGSNTKPTELATVGLPIGANPSPPPPATVPPMTAK